MAQDGGVQQLDLSSYVQQLAPQVRNEVLGSPWTAQALFRALPPLAQLYVLRLLYVDAAVTAESMRLWVQAGAELQHHKTVQQLELLSVLQQARPGAVVLHPAFKACLRAALSGRGCSMAPPGQAQAVQQLDQLPSVQDIRQQASRHWQALLLYLLDSQQRPPMPEGLSSKPVSIQALLRSAGLIAGTGRKHELTAAGFRYLLKGSSEQVWLLLRQYIHSAEAASGKELASTLSFLMQLSFRRPWQPYPLAGLTQQEQDIACHMAQLGLVHTFLQGGSSYFCVTPLAAALCGGGSAAGVGPDEDGAALGGGGGSSSAGAGSGAAGGGGAESGGYIIVETNFRVYAHTSSELQRRVLARLMRTDCLLPNLYVGTLTREAFLAALEHGIGAADVAGFLQAHAHPQVSRRVPCVPENVQEQLVLWEGESRRVAAQAATLYTSFEDEELFLAAAAHAQSLGIALWLEPRQAQLVVLKSGHEALKGFIMEFKAQRARLEG